MKGHPIRGFIAGLLLGIVLDVDLFLGGVVESDSATLVGLPVVCIVVVFLLGLWAPIGRRHKPKEGIRPNAQPLPAPVAWPKPRRSREAHRHPERGRHRPRADRPTIPRGAGRRRRLRPPTPVPRRRRLRPRLRRHSRFDRTPASRWHAPMDFNDTPEEAAWRAECRAWLEEQRPEGRPGRPTPSTIMEIGGGDYLDRAEALAGDEVRRRASRASRGSPSSAAATARRCEQIIFGQEEARFAVPERGVRHRSRDDRADAARGRHRRRRSSATSPSCCAARRSGRSSSASRARVPTSRRSSTTATRDGDEWVINGQKVWTSGAQYSDFGEIVCRTNPDAEKHKGITAFIVDMRAPGVTIKPLKQMNGGAGFNEVFFDDVRVPHEHVLGDVNEGWTVAITTLMNERVAIGSGGGGGGRGGVHQLIDARAGARRRTPTRACASSSPTSTRRRASRSSCRCAR